MLYDHIDLRVTNFEKVRALYDAILPALGFSRLNEGPEDINYHRPAKNHAEPFFGLMLDPKHRPNGSRIAFRVDSRQEVDRIANVARNAGARAFEPAETYDADHPYYYAAFFEDADGNKLEVVYRE